MKHNAIATALPMLLVLAVSGCTIPGTDIALPFPNIFGGQTTDYTNDIIIIRSLQITPGTTVKSKQAITLYADIENVQDPEKVVGLETPEVHVDLYDHCTTLFESVEPNSDLTFKMNPKEIKTVSWKLIPRDVSLITPCELKVKITYSYQTETITSITFINAVELSNRVRRGEPYQVSGSTTRGYGPVKVYLEVESQQPVPDGEDSSASISMKIKNVGHGYVKDSMIEKDKFDAPEAPGGTDWEDNDCDFEYNKIEIRNDDEKSGIKLVRKETTPKFCKLKSPDVEVEQTYEITAKVGYDYEFRKSIHMQIEPR